jgi:hypothetical protein
MTNAHFHQTEHLLERIRWRFHANRSRAVRAASSPGAAPSTGDSLLRKVLRRVTGRRPRYTLDIALPADFGADLGRLVHNGREVLLVHSRSEAGYSYLRRKFGRELDRLSAMGGLQIHVVDRDIHVFSNDDVAAAELNAVVARWAQARFPVDSPTDLIATARS